MSFAPLLLSAHIPARLSVEVPCAVVRRSVPVGDERFTILATAHSVSSSRGLGLVIEQQELRLGVGDAILARGAWPEAALEAQGCTISAAFEAEKWRLEIGGRELGQGTSTAPVVTGLFTQLPRAAAGTVGLSVRVVTSVAGSSPSPRQIVCTVIAVAAGVAALILLVRSAGRRVRTRARSAGTPRVRSVVRALGWVDTVVVVALGAWWVFGPVLWDDGWIQSVVLRFPETGAFSNYYEIFDAQYPLGFLHFLFHFGSSLINTSLLWMRLPVLVIGVATWALLRVYLARLRVADGGGPRVALASVFLAFWFAWLSTLRPEPIVALLSVIVLVAVQGFYRTAALGALAVAVFAATVAVTIHPEGVIAVAPLLVAAPVVWRWTREHGVVGVVSVVALGLAAAAALFLLVTADSDLAQWRHNRHIFATQQYLDPRVAHPVALSWRDELLRYQLLFQPGLYSSVVRRGSVVFAVVAVVLFVTRLARRREAAFDLPVMSLVVGVMLMALTPSKWPWQLGALGGFAALAVATEVCRLGLEPMGSRSRNGRSLLMLGATVVAAVIAWRGGAEFGDFAILEVDFGRGGSGFWRVDLSSPVPWLVVALCALVTCAVIVTRRRRFAVRSVVDQWLAYTGVWAVPVSVGIVLAATLGLFVTDAFAHSPAWSLPRQHYDELTGSTCGIADDIGVADPTTGTPLEPDPVPAPTETQGLPWAARGARAEFTAAGSPPPAPGVDLGTRWGSRISGDQDTGVFFSPWFRVPADATTQRIDRHGLVLFTAGKTSSGNRVVVQFGRREGQVIYPLTAERVAAPDSDAAWQPSNVRPPAATDRVRVIAVDATRSPGGWVAFTAPRRVRFQSLSRVLTRPGTTALIGPNIRFYFPCATNPTIAHGRAHAPDYEVGIFLTPVSPMAGISDLYESQQLLTRTGSDTTVHDLNIKRIIKEPAPADPTPLRG